MLKNKYAIILSILVFTSIIIIISCGRKGILKQNADPHIVISEYSGIAKTDTTWSDSTMFEEIGSLIDPVLYDSLFCQTIYWRAWDVDGTVQGYAYRIGTWDTLDADEDNYKWNDDPTKTFWDYDNAYGITVDTVENMGWVLHLQPNGEYGIWTSPDERYAKATVYFPSTDTTDFKNNFGKFEVKCIDNGGKVSKPAVKYFATYSAVPTTYISTSQGNIDSRRVGTAVLFKFFVNDEDGKEAAYYKYRLVYVERVGAREDTLGKDFDNYKFSIGTEILPSSDTTCYFTQGFEKPEEVLLRTEYPSDDPYADRKPTLLANDINELTQIQVKAVDKAGIEDPQYETMTFFVRDYFKPETRPFMSSIVLNEKTSLNILPNIYVLGENHYLTYLETDEVPKKLVDDEYHYATQFYYNKNEKLTALWSDDIEIHLCWEYYGEYLCKYQNSNRVYKGYSFHYDENLPAYSAFPIGEDLLLTDGYCKYYCDIEYMDIQLDNSTTGLPPISTAIVSDESGDWMRIPIEKNQECKLFDISPGEHIFKVRAVDLQGAVDPTPETLEFELVEMPEEKNGILLFDDTPHSNLYSPEEDVDTFYDLLIEECAEIVEVYDEDELGYDLNNGIGHAKNPYFAPSDIINYKLIIWHANNAQEDFQNVNCLFKNHYNILSIFLESGGNVLFTGGPNIKDKSDENKPFLQEYAGFSENHYTLNRSLDPSPFNCDFVFSLAEGMEDYKDLNLNINLWLNINTTYSEDQVTNGKFDDWTDNLPEHWLPSDTTSLIIDSTASSQKKLIISYTNEQNYVYQNIYLDTLNAITNCDSVKFELKYKSKQDLAGGQYKIEVYDFSHETILTEIYHTNYENWESYTDYFFVFQIPTICDSIQLRLWTPNIQGKKSYWDNISLKFGYYYPEYFATTYIGGIGGITYFDLDAEAIPIYSFGIPEDGNSNAEGYIGSKYTKENCGTTYILGFPLYYIQLDDAKTFIHKIFDDVGISH